MTIFITGGASFIGSNFVLDWLAQYDEPIVNLDKLTYEANLESLVSLQGDARHVYIQYAVQRCPDGLAQAFIIGRYLVKQLQNVNQRTSGASVFAYHVHDPERYGVVAFDDQQRANSIEEKPKAPQSNYAVTGLYFYNQQVCDITPDIKPSARGELEITDLNRRYLEQGQSNVEITGSGYAWLDTGTHDSLLEAASFFATLQKCQGLQVACPEEIAFHQDWINAEQQAVLADPLKKNGYGQYLLSLLM